MRESAGSIRLLPVWLLLGATIVVGVIWALSAQNYGAIQNREQVPLILPLEGPIKIKPDDPGGIEILYPDVEILKNSSLSEMGSSIKLLPAAEEPQKLPVWAEDQVSYTNEKLIHSTLDKPSITPEKEGAEKNLQDSGKKFLQNYGKSNKGNSKREIISDKEEYETNFDFEDVGGEELLNGKIRGHELQVGATQSEKFAIEEARRITQKHANILGDRVIKIVKVDLGGKGVWYRLRIPNFSSRGSSDDICYRLKLLEVNCFVVK